ncbi:MAG: two-component regulator propeller domain-containing protein, partial [Pseudomonadota bacterium]
MGHHRALIAFRRQLVTLFYLLSSASAVGIEPSEYNFLISPASRELSQKSVRTIFQDSQGFMWFLTQEGLNRFDGYTVIKFRASNQDDSSISHQSITGIVEDARGYLWISTAGGGLNRYDPGTQTFEAVRSQDTINSSAPLSDSIFGVFLDSSGQIWLGYDNGIGFSRFDPKSSEFTHFPPDSRNSLTKFVSFAEQPSGVIWAVAENLGLLRINSSDYSSERVALTDSSGVEISLRRPTHIMVDSRGDLWISSLEEGLIRYSPAVKKVTRFQENSSQTSIDSSNDVYVSMEDSVGNVW